MIGLNNGSQVAVDSIVSTGAASKIVLISDRTTLYADGDDVTNIEAYVVDASDRHIWNATNTLSYAVAGNGRKVRSASLRMDYQLDKSFPVRISVLIPSGRLVEEFDEGLQDRGFHTWSWNAVPGEHAYLIRLNVGGISSSKLAIIP